MPEWEVTRVASMSSTISVGRAPCAQARSRALPRAERMPFRHSASTAVDHPPGGRVRGDLAKQIDLIAQRPQIRQAVAAIGEHDGQVAHHAAGIVGRGAPAGARHRLAEPGAQAEPVDQLNKQCAAGVGHHPGRVRHDV